MGGRISCSAVNISEHYEGLREVNEKINVNCSWHPEGVEWLKRKCSLAHLKLNLKMEDLQFIYNLLCNLNNNIIITHYTLA